MENKQLDATLAERNSTHGDFRKQFDVAQRIKAIFRVEDYGNASNVQREALDQIAHKLSRILTGNPDHLDHWADIAGYAMCIVKGQP